MSKPHTATWWCQQPWLILSLISDDPRSRCMLGLMLLLCPFWILIRFARSLRFLVGLIMVPAIQLFFRDFFWGWGLFEYWIRVITTVCSGSLVWLFSPVRDAHKFTLPGGWLHQPFRGHRPYRLRSDDSATVVAPGLMLDNFLPIPDAESVPFYPSILT